jgi:hypothetical protein
MPNPALKALHTLGEPAEHTIRRPDAWSDYADLALTSADTRDLLAVMKDIRLLDDEGDAFFARVHAWRALAAIADASAVPALLDLLDRACEEDDEWALEEIPCVLAAMGPPAIEHIARFVPDQRHLDYARVSAANALDPLALAHPELRDRAVRIITDALALAKYNEPDINALFVGILLDMRAAEAGPAIRAAYEGGHIDEQVVGSLEEVLEDIRAPRDNDDED